jgi:hypothetical protein
MGVRMSRGLPSLLGLLMLATAGCGGKNRSREYQQYPLIVPVAMDRRQAMDPGFTVDEFRLSYERTIRISRLEWGLPDSLYRNKLEFDVFIPSPDGRLCRRTSTWGTQFSMQGPAIT